MIGLLQLKEAESYSLLILLVPLYLNVRSLPKSLPIVPRFLERFVPARGRARRKFFFRVPFRFFFGNGNFLFRAIDRVARDLGALPFFQEKRIKSLRIPFIGGKNTLSRGGDFSVRRRLADRWLA